MIVIDLPIEERLQRIRKIASIDLTSSPSREDFSQSEANQRKQRLITEQKNWFARPAQERQQYAGQYVAVYESQVVDSDFDQRQLYLRTRNRFGRQPVLIIHADLSQTPVFTFHIPQDRP